MFIRKIKKGDSPFCLELFFQNYLWEKETCTVLPAIDESKKVREFLLSFIEDMIEKNRTHLPGFVCFESKSSSQLLGYMLPAHSFDFKAQKAVMVPEFCHGALGDPPVRERIYQRLYEHCAEAWIDQGRFLHLIGSFYHDQYLKNILFSLGFGGILAERVRDLSPVICNSKLEITPVKRSSELEDIEREHHLFYPQSPVFITKTTDPLEIRREVENYFDQGNAIFAFRKEGIIQGYIVVGESEPDGEGFLLRDSNTAQIKSAFIKKQFRSGGIGDALLGRAVSWAKENNFDRLFVEHETANIYGGNYWAKHFDPYLIFSMRYVDTSL